MEDNKFGKLDGHKCKIAIVRARFNENITNDLVKGSQKALQECGVLSKNIKIFSVPGSLEIPLLCQALARKKKFNGLVTIGAVIKGETADFEYVAKTASEGILRVMLDHHLPITFGVITAYNLDQAKKRSENNKSNKGFEAAKALIEMIAVLSGIK